MNAVLEEVRRLNAARQRGEISEREFARIRVKLEGAIRETDVVTMTPALSDTPEPKLWHIALFMALVFSIGTTLVALLIGNWNIALTFAVTVFAAGTVHASQKLKD